MLRRDIQRSIPLGEKILLISMWMVSTLYENYGQRQERLGGKYYSHQYAFPFLYHFFTIFKFQLNIVPNFRHKYLSHFPGGEFFGCHSQINFAGTDLYSCRATPGEVCNGIKYMQSPRKLFLVILAK